MAFFCAVDPLATRFFLPLQSTGGEDAPLGCDELLALRPHAGRNRAATISTLTTAPDQYRFTAPEPTVNG
jgi:hypothetical protein